MLRYAIALSLAGTSSLAGTLQDEDQLTINALNSTDFEVVLTQSSEPFTFWCGAATYHERRMGRSPTDRLYVKAPRGPSRTQSGATGVVFTTEAAGIVPVSSYSVGVDIPGLNMASNKARSFCRDAFNRASK